MRARKVQNARVEVTAADGTPYVPSDDIEIEFSMYSYKDTGEHAFTVHQGGLTEKQMNTILANMGHI